MLLIPYPSIPNTSLISSRLGPEAQQSLIIKSEPHSSKWENWHPKSVLSESKVHTFLLRRLRFIYSPTVCPIAPALFVEKPIIPPLNCFLTFVKKKKKPVCIFVWVYFWFLCYIHWSTCLSIHQSHSLDYCSYIINLVSRLIFPFILIFQNCFS